MEYFSTEKRSQSKSTIVNRQEGNDSQIKHHWRMAQKIYATVTEYSWEGEEGKECLGTLCKNVVKINNQLNK